MPTPITFKNVAAPRFSNTGLAAALQAFSGAGAGFRNQASTLRDNAIERATNQAISSRLADSGQLSDLEGLDPRADAKGIFDLINKDIGQRDTLANSQLSRAISQNTLDEAPDKLLRAIAQSEANINESNAAIAFDTQRTEAGRQTTQQKKDIFDQEVAGDAAITTFNQAFAQLGVDKTAEGRKLAKTELGDNPTEDAITAFAAEFSQRAQANAVTSRQLRDQLGTTPRQFQKTIAGRNQAKAAERNFNIDAELQKILAKRDEKTQTQFQAAVAGDRTGIGVNSLGTRTLLDKKTAKQQAITTAKGLRNSINQVMGNKTTGKPWFDQTSFSDNKRLTQNFNDVATNVNSKVVERLAQIIKDSSGGDKLNSEEFAQRLVNDLGAFAIGSQSFVDSLADPGTADPFDARALDPNSGIGAPPPADIVPRDSETNISTRVKQFETALEKVKTNLDGVDKEFSGFFNRPRRAQLRKLRDAVVKGKAFPGAQDNSMSLPDREAALTQFNETLKVFRKEDEADNLSNFEISQLARISR